jgi:hypothetical protein
MVAGKRMSADPSLTKRPEMRVHEG